MQGTALSGTRPDDTPLHGLVAATGKSPIITSAFHKPLLPHQLAAVENRKPKPPKLRLPGIGPPNGSQPRTLARVNSYHEIPKEQARVRRAVSHRGALPPTESRPNAAIANEYHWKRARRYVQMSSLLGSGISQARRDSKKKNRLRRKTEKLQQLHGAEPRTVSRNGVSLGFLEHIVTWSKSLRYPQKMEDGREIHSYRDLTCEDILDILVLPRTQGGEGEESCSYADFLTQSRSRFDDRPAVGRATVFVAYCRSYIFLDFVSALSELGGKYMWIDMWSENQAELIEDPPDEQWLQAFAVNVKDIGHTVVVFDQWENASPMSRLWCLYELAITADSFVAFEVALFPGGAADMSTALCERFKDLAENTVVDFSAAKIEDEDERSLLVEALGSVELLVDRQSEIQGMLRDWLTDQGRKALREMPSASRATSDLGEQLANQLKQLGRLSEALPLMRQRLAGAKMKFGDESKEALACMHALGELHHLRWLCKDGDGHNELTVALPLLIDALNGRREMLGPTDIRTLCTVDTLALVYHDMEELDLARRYSEEAVSGFSFVLGDGHPYLLTAQQNLGLILREQGELDAALPLHLDAYTGKEATYGPKALETIDAASALGWLYVKRGETALAAEALRTAVSGNRTVRGDSHPSTVMDAKRLHKVLSNLKAVAVNDTGSFDLELAELNKVISFSHKAKSTAGVLQQLDSMASSQRDRRTQELEMLESVYEDCRKSHGTHDPRTLECLATIGWYHQVHGKNPNVAVNSLRQALVGLTNLVDENGVHHPLVPKVAKHLKITLERMAIQDGAEDGQQFQLDASEMAILHELTSSAGGEGQRRGGRRKVWVAAKTAIMLRTALTKVIDARDDNAEDTSAELDDAMARVSLMKQFSEGGTA
jgi:tetratricopeptide (TPR) repeat protein